MDGRIDQVIKVFTTPQELRALADKAEKLWSKIQAGDDKTFHREYLTRIVPVVEIHFLIDQTRMNE